MWHEPFVAVACSAVAGEVRRDLAGREGGWELSTQAPTVCQVWMHSYRTQDPASTPVPAATNIVPRKLLTEIRQWNFSALHHIFTDQMLTRLSAEDLLSFFYYFTFSLFHFSICVLYFFCLSARPKLLLLRTVKSLRCPQHQASQDGARSTGTTQALQEMSTTRELMRLSPDTASLSTKKKCSLVALFFFFASLVHACLATRTTAPFQLISFLHKENENFDYF